MPLNRAELCMIARDTRIIDHKVIFQPAPDGNDRLDQGIEFDAVDDNESIWGNSIDLCIHRVIIMGFCLPRARMQSFCIVS